jgi:hypothetical protein
MALQFLDKNVIGQYLREMWKKNLNTGEDPANGKWFENGANTDGRGLYGGLTDTASTSLIFDESQKSYTPQDIIADSATIDNRNGLTPNSTVTLSYAYADSTSSTQTTTAAIKIGVGFDFKASATIFGIGGEATTKFSFEFSYSWTDSKTETQTKTRTFSQAVPVAVPTARSIRWSCGPARNSLSCRTRPSSMSAA